MEDSTESVKSLLGAQPQDASIVSGVKTYLAQAQCGNYPTVFSLFSPNHDSVCDFYQFSSPRSDAGVQRCSAGYPELDKQAKAPGSVP